MRPHLLFQRWKLNSPRLLLVCSLLSLGNVAGQVVSVYPAATPTSGMQKGDFNGDGTPDLVATSDHDPRISILIGNSDGSFKAAQYIAVGKYNTDIAVGDVNGDGKLDIVLATANATGAVAVLLGKGDGTFQAPTYLPIPGADYVALADLNGDKILDLVISVAGTRVPVVAVYLGTGTGNFITKVTLPIASYPASHLVIADFNHDAKLDLAVYTGTGNVSVLLGLGDGNFRPAVNTQVSEEGFRSFTSGDFNGDGIVDLAVAETNYPSLNGTIRIFFGKGDGSFQYGADASLASSSGSQPGAFGVAVGDVNGDGKLDLVVGVGYSDGVDVVVSLGNGDGTFGPVIRFGFGYLVNIFVPAEIVLGDFNHDGKLDIAVAAGYPAFQSGGKSFPATGSVAVYLNTNFTTITLVVNAATPAGTLNRPVSAGEIVYISGSNLGPSRLTASQPTALGFFSTVVGQTQVLFDGVPAPLIYTRNDQVCAVVPYAVATQDHTSVQVEYEGFKSNALILPVAAASPALFVADTNQALILNGDGTQNSPSNPAAKGSIVSLFATGMGQTTPPSIDGALGSPPLPQPLLPVNVLIYNEPAEIIYAGAMPFAIAGLMLVDARVPSDVLTGRMPILLKIGDFSSQIGLTTATQ